MQFKDFISQYPDAYPGAGFFIIDFENTDASQRHLDYYIPQEKKIASFDLMGNHKISEQLIEKPLQDLGEIKLSIDDVIQIIRDELLRRDIKLGIKKVIAVLQVSNLELLWSISCILSNTDFAKMRILDSDSIVKKFEIISLMSLINVKKKQPIEKVDVGGVVDGSVEFYDIVPGRDDKDDKNSNGGVKKDDSTK